MKVIIPGIWSVCIAAKTVQAVDSQAAIWMATELVNRAVGKAGLIVTAEELKTW